MSTGRTILHVDMDAFFASVEQRDDPALRGRPVLVGGAGPRGVVAAASYEARRFGCRSAQPTAIALRMCPDAVVVKGRYDAYREASDRVFQIMGSFTPLIEPLSIDEAFLDVTGSLRLFAEGAEIARRIRKRVAGEVGLTASVGVAPNKFLAKVASDVDKPDGLTVIEPGRVDEFLTALPVEAVFGIGPKMCERLRRMGVRKVGDLRAFDVAALESRFGVGGRRMWHLARGIDERPVVPDHAAKSIGHERTFGEDLTDPDEVRRVMLAQTEDVARRVRRRGALARTVTVKIRYGRFETITRSRTLDESTDRTDALWRAAAALFDAWVRREGFRPVRLIGVQAGNFTTQGQPGLFTAADDQRRRAVERATDAIVERFGKGAIRRGGTL